MMKNNDLIMHNGQTVQAVQPVTFKDGASYLPFRTIAELYNFRVSYDKSTKESIATGGGLEFRFTPDTAYIQVNGESIKSSGKVYIQNGYMMVPLRTWADLTGSALTLKNGVMTFRWSFEPTANFTVDPEEIFAGQTTVTYTDQSKSPGGAIIDERWEGRQDVFTAPGDYVVTRWVMDERGVWSEPYSVSVHVEKPNEPPVANFTTDKSTYRIGEPVNYRDLSTDDKNDIVRRTWTSNEPAFFQAGTYQIELEVEDGEGLVHTATKVITVTEEVLYNENDFYRLFTPTGDKFPISARSVLDLEEVRFDIEPEDTNLIHSNSPERLLGEGVAYEDTVSGQTRFLFHNQNDSDKNLTLYVLATNPNATYASLTMDAFGIGGPNTYVSTGGKLASSRFMKSWLDPLDDETITLAPGESKLIMPNLSRVPIKPGQIVSAYADILSNQDIAYKVLVVDSTKDPLEALPQLKPLARDQTHVRGTFPGADRVLRIDGTIGATGQRIEFGGRKSDRYLTGEDRMTGTYEMNNGNFGVMYKMNITVAPRTVIAINPRGGHYAGAFLVNDKIVSTTENSILKGSWEAGVLYRSGNTTEQVELSFMLASGSNMPIQMIFLPMPEAKS
ncbi:copper amine oxidase N-terminal domain-containing protein [Paenibacillus sp. IB182496]|uniref:Copper amine oxidase N-terminal domain-containing protein n=1 Tax=Paenibacillus sabuli TaxID=2772509 RepID=A0A927BWY6_9BACL|nr:copper amine oxidase N-terminal domain-containing protein [Paenibacillus sabuli]